MKKTAIIIMAITVFSKIFGFAREIILSYFYGASNISDIYLVSLTIPGVIFSFIGVGISTGYIPMYSKIVQANAENEGLKFTNKLVNILIVICTTIVLVSILFTDQIVRMFASGFTGQTLALAIQFTRVSVIGIYFSGLIYLFSGFLQLKGNYSIPALIGFPLNAIVILSVFWSFHSNIYILTIGSLIAVASQFILLVPFIKKKGYKYKFLLDLKDKHIANMAVISLPIIIGTSVNQINVIVDKTIASQIAIGGISALNYANKLNLFIQGIFVMSIATVMFPVISKLSAEGNMMGLKKSISDSINVINLLVIPATIGAMIFAEPIIRLLFGRGAFDNHAIAITSSALFFYSIGMVAFGLREVLSRVFYSIQDTKTPMINAAISMVLNIILNIILSQYMGIGGLALATSISAIVCTILLFVSLRKKMGPIGIKAISISFIKILFAALVMGLIAKLSYNFLVISVNPNKSLLISIVIGALIYIISIYFMQIDYIRVPVKTIVRKLKD